MSNYKQAEQLLKERKFFVINTLSASTRIHKSKTIYAIDSYSTTVAYVCNDVCYIHNHKFSSTTSRHIGIIKRAFFDVFPIRLLNTSEFQNLANLPDYKVFMSKRYDYGEFQKKPMYK